MDPFSRMSVLIIHGWILSLELSWAKKVFLAYIEFRTNKKHDFAMDYQEIAEIMDVGRTTAANNIKELVDAKYLNSAWVAGKKVYSLGEKSLILREGVQKMDPSKNEISPVQKTDSLTVQKTDSSPIGRTNKKINNFPNNKEESLLGDDFDAEVKNELAKLRAGVWKGKDRNSFLENLRFLKKYSTSMQLEIIQYTFRGEYPAFYAPKEDNLSKAENREKQPIISYSPVGDESFRFIQPNDKNPSSFRVRIRSAWASLGKFCNSDYDRDNLYSEMVSFLVTDGVLEITFPKDLKEVANLECLLQVFSTIEGVNSVKIRLV